MVTAIEEEITYCSPGTSPGKQKKTRPEIQPQFCSENNLSTIEEDQILLAIQQLANNTNCAIFHSNFHQVSKFPRSLTTTVPIFEENSEKKEQFEDLSNKPEGQKPADWRNKTITFTFLRSGRIAIIQKH